MSNPATLADKLQTCPKGVLYLLLIAVTSIPLWVPLSVPNEPQQAAKDFYETLYKIPEGKTVLIASDWTNSTRGESEGSFKALIRILMRRNIKFAIYSTGDPQAPEVARKAVARINKERVEAGEPEYKRYEQWLSLPFFANSEGTTGGIGNNIRAIFANARDAAEGQPPMPVLDSPVLKDVQKVSDLGLVVNVTASKTADIIVERLFGKVPLAFMVTGVMVPETANYYSSGQIKGLIGGLKGVYDLEELMQHGINEPAADGKIRVKSEKNGVVPSFKVDKKYLIGTGTMYYPALHGAITLLILCVVVGNIGMFLGRKAGK
jgi:hypothetical protein